MSGIAKMGGVKRKSPEGIVQGEKSERNVLHSGNHTAQNARFNKVAVASADRRSFNGVKCNRLDSTADRIQFHHSTEQIQIAHFCTATYRRGVTHTINNKLLRLTEYFANTFHRIFNA